MYAINLERSETQPSRDPCLISPFAMVSLSTADGSAPFEGDIGIKGDRIAEMGRVGAAHQEIIAAGSVVSPGFIDFPHSRRHAVVPGSVQPGEACSGSYHGHLRQLRFSAPFHTVVAEHQKTCWEPTARGVPTPNMWTRWVRPVSDQTWAHVRRAQHTGKPRHAPDRQTALEQPTRPPLWDAAKRAVEQGALGISTGLIYEPGRYSNFEDLVEIISAVADLGGLHSTHLRDEGFWTAHSDR